MPIHDTLESYMTPKNAWFLILFAVTLVFAILLGDLWVSHLTIRNVLVDGLQTEAVLEEKYRDDEERFWLRYRFTTLSDDTYLSAIEVNQMDYIDYTIGESLPMRYAPNNPNHNALDLLEDEIRREMWDILRLSIILIIIMLLQAYGISRMLPLNRLRFWQKTA